MGKKIEVFFNEESYKKDLELFTKKMDLKDQIWNEVKRHLKVDLSPDANIFNSPLSSFYKLAKDKLTNPMNLSGEKLIDLYDMDISKLLNACEKWEVVKNLTKPRRHEYCIYAETKEQIEKYHSVTKLIKSLNEVHQYLPMRPSPLNYIIPFKFLVKNKVSKY